MLSQLTDTRPVLEVRVGLVFEFDNSLLEGGIAD